MKEYLFFYSRLKKANSINVIRFIINSLGFNEFVIFLMKILLYILFLSGIALSGSKGIFIIPSVAFVTWSILEFRKEITFNVAGFFDGDIEAIKGESLYKLISFIIFIGSIDKEIDRKSISNAISYCDKELDINSYSFITTHPIFILYTSIFSASLALFFSNKENTYVYVFLIMFVISYFVFFIIYNSVSKLRRYKETKRYCQWIDYFEINELDKIKSKMKLIGF